MLQIVEASDHEANILQSLCTGYGRKYVTLFFNTTEIFPMKYNITVVKELRSKMFRQHPGYYKAVFLKKTQTIIVSFYEYTVYVMF